MTMSPFQRFRAKMRYDTIRKLGEPATEAQKARISVAGFLGVLKRLGITEAQALERYGDLARKMPSFVWPEGKPNPRKPTGIETQRKLRDRAERSERLTRMLADLLHEWLRTGSKSSELELEERTTLILNMFGLGSRVVNADDMCGVAPMHLTAEESPRAREYDNDQDEALSQYCNQPHDFETRDDLNDSDDFEVTP